MCPRKYNYSLKGKTPLFLVLSTKYNAKKKKSKKKNSAVTLLN